jgi:hypothetical protein
LGLLSLAASLVGVGPAYAQVTLRYKFKQGETLNYDLEQKMKMEMAIAGQNINMSMTQTLDMTWKVESVDNDGKAKITQKFDRVRLSMEGLPGMDKIQFDSKEGKELEGPFGQMMGPMLKALAGAEFSMTMDAQGKVSDFKLPEKLADAFKNIPGATGAGGMFTEEGLKHMMGQASLTFPSEPLTAGKSWEQKLTMKLPTGGKMNMDNQCTYEGEATVDGRKLEKIAMKPKMSIEAEEGAAFKMKMKSQDAKGTAYFNNLAGHLDHLDLSQKMDTEVSTGGMDFTQKIEQTVSFKLKNKTS